MKPVFCLVALLSSFLVFCQDKSILDSIANTDKEKPFRIIENVPVYKGCENKMDNTSKKKCMSQKIALLFRDNFNNTVPKNSNLKPGLVSVYVAFKVGSDGVVKDISVRAQDDYLIDEAKRVTKLIPKLKPGYFKDKPVTVPYALPLRINLKADTTIASLSSSNSINKTYPVYRGCHKESNYENTKKCTTDKIADYIKVSFDYVMADRVFPTAKSTSFQVDFVINEKGKPENVNAKANDKAIAIEAIRLIKRMPKLKQPGTENGKAVKTPISLLMTVYF